MDLAVPTANRGASVLADSFTSIEAIWGTTKGDVLRGDAGNNLFLGNNGSDKLSGGDGADTHDGGAGKDTMTGGSGADICIFSTKTGGPETITDFTTGTDKIHLEVSLFGHGSATGAISAVTFVTSTTNAALDSNDRFIFRTTDGTLWCDKDGNGSKAAVMVANLQDDAVLVVDDLWLI